MSDSLLLVTGAPGAGKSVTLESLLVMNPRYLVLDIDWLAGPAGELAAKDIYTDSSTWKPYARLWFEVLHSISRNGVQPIFFCPNSLADINEFGVPAWCRELHWLLLDCSNEIRRQRLGLRTRWSPAQTEEAIDDAKELRESISPVIDTGFTAPDQVALEVLAWADSCQAG